MKVTETMERNFRRELERIAGLRLNQEVYYREERKELRRRVRKCTLRGLYGEVYGAEGEHCALMATLELRAPEEKICFRFPARLSEVYATEEEAKRG